MAPPFPPSASRPPARRSLPPSRPLLAPPVLLLRLLLAPPLLLVRLRPPAARPASSPSFLRSEARSRVCLSLRSFFNFQTGAHGLVGVVVIRVTTLYAAGAGDLGCLLHGLSHEG